MPYVGYTGVANQVNTTDGFGSGVGAANVPVTNGDGENVGAAGKFIEHGLGSVKAVATLVDIGQFHGFANFQFA